MRRDKDGAGGRGLGPGTSTDTGPERELFSSNSTVVI